MHLIWKYNHGYTLFGNSFVNDQEKACRFEHRGKKTGYICDWSAWLGAVRERLLNFCSGKKTTQFINMLLIGGIQVVLY